MFSIQPFLSRSVFPLKPGDKPEFAIEMMEDWKLHSLPVAEDGKYLGMVQKSDLEGVNKVSEVIVNNPEYVIPARTFLWKLLELFQQTGDQIKVVVDEDNQYDLTESRIEQWCQQVKNEINEILTA